MVDSKNKKSWMARWQWFLVRWLRVEFVEIYFTPRVYAVWRRVPRPFTLDPGCLEYYRRCGLVLNSSLTSFGMAWFKAGRPFTPFCHKHHPKGSNRGKPTKAEHSSNASLKLWIDRLMSSRWRHFSLMIRKKSPITVCWGSEMRIAHL